MKRASLSLLALVMVILTACSPAASGTQDSGKPAPVVIHYSEGPAATYIDQLYTALSDASLPVLEKKATSQAPDADADIGDYLYTGYPVSKGVHAIVYEDPKQTELSRVMVTVDLSQTKLDAGAFVLSNVIDYFDHDNAAAIADTLQLQDLTSSGISEAKGSAGSYKFMVTPGSLAMLIYTAAPAAATVPA